MAANQKISFEIKDKLAYLGFGHREEKSMAVLGRDTLRELENILSTLRDKRAELRGAIFFSHLEKCFLAGADINLIASLTSESEGAREAEAGQALFNQIEDLPFPTVACVHGVCLGGGTELALACQTLLLAEGAGTQIGLPEVKLGILPGLGGTYRLPRRVGLPTALDMILTGKTLVPAKAFKVGLADAVYPKERLLAMARKHIEGTAPRSRPHPKNWWLENFVGRKLVFQRTCETVLKRTRGLYQAPLKILEAMEEGMNKGRSSYLSLEAQAFGELCVGEQSKNLQHIFFMSEKAKKYQGPASSGKLPVLSRGACLGAGTMGGGITWLMANQGMYPLMRDLNTKALELGLAQANANFAGAVKRKKMSPSDLQRKMRSITAQRGLAGFGRVDLLVEAIVEDMAIKKKALAEVEKHMHSAALITSNTSSLSIEEMAGALERPENFAGLHFFNPVHRMPLVEIITHSKIAPTTVEALYRWALKCKKTPVVVKDGPGFLVNRILMPYLNESAFLLEEGHGTEALDEVCLDFGMPMGPLRLLDEVGLDVAAKVAAVMRRGLGERAQSSPLLEKMVEQGHLGKKSGRGFYLYDERGKPRGVNRAAEALFSGGRQRRKDKAHVRELQWRLFLPMVNEAASILQDELVSGPSAIDLGMIFGIGFPPFRGGLLRYADGEGLGNIVEALQRFAGEVNEVRFRPCEHLEKLASRGQNFYSAEG